MMRKKKVKYIVGVDEAGRGPLAGPLAVGAVAWPVSYAFQERFADVRDSKQLTAARREYFFRELRLEHARCIIICSVAFIAPRIIDAHGMTKALRLGVSRALEKLCVDASLMDVMLDGSLFAPQEYTQQTIIRGDETVPIISAASIIAKVSRDKHMMKIAKKYPQYGFEKHKGYGTRAHYEALREHGISPIHRKLFLRKWKRRIRYLTNKNL
ncbi:MAG: ribonuclease HII [Candidatus Lloydbacteria bacterium]|nr:ribonuclease HII [Candidatus Lloydbacteria bacterium]